MKTCLAVLFTLSYATAAAATAPEAVVGSHPRVQQLVLSHGDPSSRPPFLAFSDQPLDVTAELLVSPVADQKVQPEWWNDVEWTLSDGSRSEIMASTDLKLLRSYAPPPSSVRNYRAEFEFPKVPVGKYELRTAFKSGPFAGLSSEPFRFEVRTGSEDRDTRRAYLRFTSDAVASKASPNRFATFRSLMLELAELEPWNPYVWERLGDIAAPVAPHEETAGYYARALTIARDNIQRQFGDIDHAPAETVTRFKQQEKRLTAFTRAVGRLRSGERITGVLDHAGKKSIVIQKGTTVVQKVE